MFWKLLDFILVFACSFAFAERGVMEGNAKIIKLIARDEALHLSGTQFILNTFALGKDDPEMAQIAKECEEDTYGIFKSSAEQEKNWAKYLFKDGSIIGLNCDILNQYIEYITNNRLLAIGLKPIYDKIENPLTWMNSWLVSDSVQVAPQEVEVSSYLVSAVNSDVSKDDFENLDL